MSESLDCVAVPRYFTDDEISYIALRTNLPKESFENIQLVPCGINEFIDCLNNDLVIQIAKLCYNTTESTDSVEKVGILTAEPIQTTISSLELNKFHNSFTH